jgi:hypothetical protein
MLAQGTAANRYAPRLHANADDTRVHDFDFAFYESRLSSCLKHGAKDDERHIL